MASFTGHVFTAITAGWVFQILAPNVQMWSHSCPQAIQSL